MHLIDAINAEDALTQGLRFLENYGRTRGSRNGEVCVAEGPVTTVYRFPVERVVFWPAREANPFFHLFEALWMLNGNRDVAPLTHYVKRMLDFSDDGKIFHGAYGYRWRHHFHFDQLELIIKQLRNNPEDRRCVLAMWDASCDLGFQRRDIPCNTQVYFSRDYRGALDMTVCCRSNDIIWGAYGANVVHFSILQEYMAAAIGCRIGRYWQVSNNYHAYTKTYEPLLQKLYEEPSVNLPYQDGIVESYPIMSAPMDEWNCDLELFMDGKTEQGFCDDFFAEVAVPMREAYNLYRSDQLSDALITASDIRATDWRLACQQWLSRRIKKRGL